jgi:hypothetical protein
VQNEKLHIFYASSSIIRKTRCAGHVARMAEMRNTYKIKARKREGKGQHGRPSRWIDNIRMDLKEAGLNSRAV